MTLRSDLVSDLCKYLNISEDEAKPLMASADIKAEKEWSDSKDHTNFYKDHEHYLAGLTHWHTTADYRLQWTEQMIQFMKTEGLHTALDFGCGIGTDGLSLAEAGMNVQLFDVGKENLKFVRWKIRQHKIRSARVMSRVKDTFDLGILCDVIGHVEKPLDLIIDMAKRCRYVFFTADFDIGVPAYPMHTAKLANFDRVFGKAFRYVRGNIFESRILAPKVAIFPTLEQMSKAGGGVARHVEALYRYLPDSGVRVVEASEADFAHCHALATHAKMLVHTNHGFYPWDSKEPIAVGSNLKLKQAISTSQRSISVSRLAPDEFEGRLKVQSTVIPNGVTPEDFEHVPVGHFSRAHNIRKPFFLWAKLTTDGICDPTPALELAAKMPDYQFVFTVVKGKVPPNVKVVGTLPYKQMQEALKDCHVLLATTTENFSVQTLEAMACGKPVLAFDSGGNAEAIVHRSTGYLARDDQDLFRGAKYCWEKAEALGANGRQRIEQHYRWDIIVPRIAQVYREAQLESIQAELDRPLVSVVIPTYNHEEFLPEAIQSVLDQTLVDVETIVVDDGSNDKSAMSKLKNAYRMVTWITKKKNQGVSAARNDGIAKARGRYIVCLDSDDKLAPEMLEKHVEVLEADNSIGLAYCDMQLFGDARGVMPMGAYSFERLKEGNFIPNCAMFRREMWVVTGGYKDINPSWEDYELWLNGGKHGFYGQRIAEPLFHYRKRKGVGRDHESQAYVARLRATVNSYHPDLYPPLVSVIIPSYNHAHYLKDSIGSVLDQTCQEFEIIVVDDGSEDDVQKAVAAFEDDRILLLKHTENRGLAETRNTGCRAARGKYFLTLDADDKIKPTFLRETIDMLEIRSDIDIAYTDIEMWGAVSRINEMPEYDFDALLKKCLMPCTSLYRREVFDSVGGYDPRMNIAWEDYLFWIRAGKLGHCGARINKPLFMYRRDRKSMIIEAQDKIVEVRRQLHDLEPELFKEGRKPMACCGRRAGTAASGRTGSQSMTSKKAVPFVGEAGLVETRYVGPKAKIPIRGAVTGAFYEFARGDTKFVDIRDLGMLLDTGMFEQVVKETTTV